MKTYVDDNIWTDTDSRGVALIGFRQQYIDQVLSECFHVVEADTRKARKGCPLMVLETNDGVSRVKSPVSGTILTFSHKARNFPDRLTESDVIVEILPEGTKLPEKVVPKKAEKFVDFNAQQNHLNDFMILDELVEQGPAREDQQRQVNLDWLRARLNENQPAIGGAPRAPVAPRVNRRPR